MGCEPMSSDTQDVLTGKIEAVNGSVVDAVFAEKLPDLHAKLTIRREKNIYLEVAEHISEDTVRAIALNPTSGLARGDIVESANQPFMMPVGESLLGRMLNVFGEPVDFKGALPENVERRPI